MKDILVHVRGFPEHTPAANFGVRLAAALGASVTAVYTCPSPVYYAPTYVPELMGAVMENARKLVKDAVQARRSFVEWAESLGVGHAEWLVAEGEPADALAQAATRHDLLVLDRPREDQGPAWDLPGFILKAGAPCIVLPQHGVHSREFGKIAVAWNGSPEAMRAVHAALPFLQGKETLLMRGEEPDKYHALDWDPPFNIAEYLGRHGARVKESTIDAERDDAGGALLEEALEFGADLFVMGAYGRSRFSEWMLGGVTRYALAWADIPLFLRH
jgi:nucleotide-binding universal stress UspA family protein